LKHWGLQCIQALFADPDRWGSVLHSLGTRGLIVWFYRDYLPFSGAHCSQDPFSFNWTQALQYVFKKEGDDRVKKAAIFFLACEANPYTRPTLDPRCHENKGDSDVEAKDRILVQQVRCELVKDQMVLSGSKFWVSRTVRT
jgi:hypothetical protein